MHMPVKSVKTGDKNGRFSRFTAGGPGGIRNPDPVWRPKEGIPGPAMEYIPEELLITQVIFHRE